MGLWIKIEKKRVKTVFYCRLSMLILRGFVCSLRVKTIHCGINRHFVSHGDQVNTFLAAFQPLINGVQQEVLFIWDKSTSPLGA